MDIAELSRRRALRPQDIAEAAAERTRGSLDAPLMVIAADRTARSLLTGGGPMMGDRADLLDRLVLALSRPGVNGVVGTPDILEDLLLLGALDGKVVFGAMNRGGLAGASWSVDDRFTAYDAEAIERAGFDGGKMLLRIDPNDPATAAALERCADAVSALAARGLTALIEPFWAPSSRHELNWETSVRALSVASALGVTSAHTWLKVAMMDEMERVLAASTLPALLLIHDGPPEYEAWERVLALPTMHGLVGGRTLLYPPGDDVAAAVDAAANLVGAMDRRIS